MASSYGRAPSRWRLPLVLLGLVLALSLALGEESSTFDGINPFDEMDALDHDNQGITEAAYLGDGNDADGSLEDTNGDSDGNGGDWLKGIENLVGLHEDDSEDRYSEQEKEDEVVDSKKDHVSKPRPEKLSDTNGDDEDEDDADTTKVPSSAQLVKRAEKASADAAQAADLAEEVEPAAKSKHANRSVNHVKARRRQSGHHRKGHKASHHHGSKHHAKEHHGHSQHNDSEHKGHRHFMAKVRRSEGSLAENDPSRQMAEHAAQAAATAASSAEKLASEVSRNSGSESTDESSTSSGEKSGAKSTTTTTTTVRSKAKTRAKARSRKGGKSDDADISRMSKHQVKKTERELESAEEEAESAEAGVGEAEKEAESVAQDIKKEAGKEVSEAEDEVETEVSGLENEGERMEEQNEEELAEVRGEGQAVEEEGKQLEEETENAVGAVAQEGLKSEAYQKKLSERSKLLAAALTEEDNKVVGIAKAGDDLAERVAQNEKAIEATQAALKKTMEAANMEAEALEARKGVDGNPSQLDHDTSVFDKQHPEPAPVGAQPASAGPLTPEKAEAEITHYRKELGMYRKTMRSYRTKLKEDEVKLAASEAQAHKGEEDLIKDAVAAKAEQEALGGEDRGEDRDDDRGEDRGDDRDDDRGGDDGGDGDMAEKVVKPSASTKIDGDTPEGFVMAKPVAQELETTERRVPSDDIAHDPNLGFVPDETLFNGTVVAKAFDEEALKEHPMRIAPPPPGMTPPDSPKRGGDPHIGIRVMSREIVVALRKLLGIPDGSPLPKEVTRVVRTALTRSFNSPSLRKALDIPVDITTTEISIPDKGTYQLRLGTAVPGGAEFVRAPEEKSGKTELEETPLNVPGIDKWAKKLYYTLGAGSKWKKRFAEKRKKKAAHDKAAKHGKRRQARYSADDMSEMMGGYGESDGMEGGDGLADMMSMMGMNMPGMMDLAEVPQQQQYAGMYPAYPAAVPPTPTNGIAQPMAPAAYSPLVSQIQAAGLALTQGAAYQPAFPAQTYGYNQAYNSLAPAYAATRPRAHPPVRRRRVHPLRRAKRRFVQRRLARRRVVPRRLRGRPLLEEE